jgi:hypothetical protein
MTRQETLPMAERRKLGRTLGHLAMELEKADALHAQARACCGRCDSDFP